MLNRIEWTQTSINEVIQVLSYLRREVSLESAQKLSDLLKKKISMLETNRVEGRRVPTKKTIRFILVGRNHRLYYRKNGLTLHHALVPNDVGLNDVGLNDVGLNAVTLNLDWHQIGKVYHQTQCLIYGYVTDCG